MDSTREFLTTPTGTVLAYETHLEQGVVVVTGRTKDALTVATLHWVVVGQPPADADALAYLGDLHWVSQSYCRRVFNPGDPLRLRVGDSDT